MQPKFPVISYPPSIKHCATKRIVSGSGIGRLDAGASTLEAEGKGLTISPSPFEAFSVGFSVGAGGGPFGSGGGMLPLAFVPSGAAPEVVLCLQKLRCLEILFFSVTKVKSKVNH